MSVTKLHPELEYSPAVYRAVGRATVIAKGHVDDAWLAYINASRVLPFTLATDKALGDVEATGKFVDHLSVATTAVSKSSFYFYEGTEQMLTELGMTLDEWEATTHD